jgi:hypothetical protein
MICDCCQRESGDLESFRCEKLSVEGFVCGRCLDEECEEEIAEQIMWNRKEEEL